MNIGSLFDGAGTFPFAAQQFGIKPCWASEIEPLPVAVTKKRFPDMVHLGDITKINGAKIKPVDVVTFGSPCQDLSVAGKQAGLCGDRSGLFIEAVRIIKEMRGVTNGKYPRYAVWENVPGAFSSNEREDFRVVLEELCKIKDESANVPRPSGKGKWQNAGIILGTGYSVAWRVLDAQFWGVPQRRRRIFLVADFRGTSAGEVLFKREGLSRSFAESRETWKGLAVDTTFGSYQAGKCFDARGNGNGNIAPTITGDHNDRITDYSAVVVYSKGTRPHNCNEGQKWVESEVANYLNTFDTGEERSNEQIVLGVDTYSQCLTGDKAKSLLASHTDKDGVPCVAINLTQDPVPNEKVFPCLSTGNPITGQANLAICYNLDSLSSNSMKSNNPNSGFHETDKHRTLDTLCHNPTCNQGGTVICVATQQGGAEIAENLCPTITAAGMSGNNQPFLCYAIDRAAFNQGQNAQYDIGISDKGIAQTLVAKGPGAVCYPIGINGEICGTLDASYYKGCCLRNGVERELVAVPMQMNWVVRRVTPIECARLQGMPDWWCKDVPHTDSAKYKMWGNGMALPCAMYVMEGIAIQLQKEMLESLEVA